jgi:aminobenzoyl-glutamate utilization protein B
MQSKRDVLQWLEENRGRFIALAEEIWADPELAFHEFHASRLQARLAEAEGMAITWDLAGMNTAFLAEWGSGTPIIGFAGEYDALPGMSQSKRPTPEPLVEGGPGHGCGHNLLGTGCLAAAVAMKHWLEATGTPGTVRYYGCPAEEAGGGKAFMARDGLFDDLDAAFNYHPLVANAASKGSTLGVAELKFRFHGVPAHAAAAPDQGRSALDAVELMNVGVNYLREHMPLAARVHYVITEGGEAPNIVPRMAEVWYFVRAPRPEQVEQVTNRVRRIAEGAALMTETRVEEEFVGFNAGVLNNHALADLQYTAMEFIGPIDFGDEERALAAQINAAYDPSSAAQNLAMHGLPADIGDAALLAENYAAEDEGVVLPASTDVGDLSRCAPLSMLSAACWPVRVPAHTWGAVVASGHAIGHKGMLHAAKVMALAAMELYGSPAQLERVRAEFEKATGGRPYRSLLPEGVRPPRYTEDE